MAAAERRRGRRDNGLDATDWRAIEDIDPRVAEEVLDLLAARGIAAYVQPAVDVDPVTRSATLPHRPADRLFVDRQQARAARAHLRGLFDSYQDRPAGPAGASDPGAGGGTGGGGEGIGDGTGRDRPAERPSPDSTAGTNPGPGSGEGSGGESGRGPLVAGGHQSDRAGPPAGADIDATFAGIVAGFDRPVDPTAAGWPAAENVPAAITEPPPVTPVERTGPVDARDLTEPSLLDALDTFGTRLPESEPPERFIPPPPPPLPRFSRQAVLGALAIIGGLILLIGRPTLLPLDRGSTMLLGFATILGGAVALILRLRPGTDPDEDRPPGDGAQV